MAYRVRACLTARRLTQRFATRVADHCAVPPRSRFLALPPSPEHFPRPWDGEPSSPHPPKALTSPTRYSLPHNAAQRRLRGVVWLCEWRTYIPDIRVAAGLYPAASHCMHMRRTTSRNPCCVTLCGCSDETSLPGLVVWRALTTRIDWRYLPGLGNCFSLHAHPSTTTDIQFYGVHMKYQRAHAHVAACSQSTPAPAVSEEATAERFLRLPEVMSACGLSRSSIYGKVSCGEFPQPVRLTPSSVAWVDSEIRQWIAGRIAARQS